MDTRISFGTKEESNARREREFLALTPAERFMWFLRSFARKARTAGKAPDDDKGNFVIRRRADAVR